MVYVFGVDLPIMEILAVLVLLILFALFLAVIEIWRLRKLIIMELEAPVSERHKDDIQDNKKKQDAGAKAEKPKGAKGKAAQSSPRIQVLENYLRSCLQRKVDMKIMNNALIARGWKQEEIDKALDDISKEK